LKEGFTSILLVEDDAVIALSEMKMLKRAGYSVMIASSGKEAIDLFRWSPNSFDLILMDIDLGSGMDGTECAQEILRTHELPILFLSSYKEGEVVEKTKRITNCGYVMKSADFSILEASIKMALETFQAHKILDPGFPIDFNGFGA